MLYLDDGAIAMDNNAAELALRETRLASLTSLRSRRKNWLFAGRELGGETCTVGTSLKETANAHVHDPQAYLSDTLERLPTTKCRDIDTLLPINWGASV